MIAFRYPFLASLLITGCGSRWVDYAATGPAHPAAPRPAADIQVFSSTRPACAYDEIGLVESNQKGFAWWGSVTEVLAAMKTTAADRGGDAILLLDHNDGHGGGHGYTGVVIQYRAPCSS